MIKLSISHDVLRSYIRYIILFFIFWIIATVIELWIGPFDNYSLNYLLLGDLAMALYVGFELACIAVGTFAMFERFRRRIFYNTVWIVLGIINALTISSVYAGVTPWLDHATQYAFTNISTDNFSVALKEQLYGYAGASTLWGVLFQAVLIVGLLPVCVSFCLNCKVYARRRVS